MFENLKVPFTFNLCGHKLGRMMVETCLHLYGITRVLSTISS
jgi:hypothetical protein